MGVCLLCMGMTVVCERYRSELCHGSVENLWEYGVCRIYIYFLSINLGLIKLIHQLGGGFI